MADTPRLPSPRPSRRRVHLDIPVQWTPEQAEAVFDLLSELADTIWKSFDQQLIAPLLDGIPDMLPDDPPPFLEHDPDDDIPY